MAIEAFSESKPNTVSHRVGSVFHASWADKEDQILIISEQGGECEKFFC